MNSHHLLLNGIDEQCSSSRSKSERNSWESSTGAKITIKTFWSIVQLRKARKGIFDMEKTSTLIIGDPSQIDLLVHHEQFIKISLDRFVG